MNFNVSFKMHKSYYGPPRGIKLKHPLKYDKIAKHMEEDPKFKQGIKDYLDKYARPHNVKITSLSEDTFVKPKSLEEAVAQSDIIVEDVDVQDIYESIKSKFSK